MYSFCSSNLLQYHTTAIGCFQLHLNSKARGPGTHHKGLVWSRRHKASGMPSTFIRASLLLRFARDHMCFPPNHVSLNFLSFRIKFCACGFVCLCADFSSCNGTWCISRRISRKWELPCSTRPCCSDLLRDSVSCSAPLPGAGLASGLPPSPVMAPEVGPWLHPAHCCQQHPSKGKYLPAPPSCLKSWIGFNSLLLPLWWNLNAIECPTSPFMTGPRPVSPDDIICSSSTLMP